MARVIHKYPLYFTEHQLITVQGPVDKVLCVQMQHGLPTMWVLRNDESSIPTYLRIRMLGTGQTVEAVHGDYLGTVQSDGLVWHYFGGAS